MTISVLVPTHGRSAFLPELIGAFERQSVPLRRFEVVVVDDASPDDSWPVLTRLVTTTPLRLKVARLDVNRGPAAARNVAAALSRAPVLAFTDDDCLPTDSWLAALEDAFAQGADIVQGRTLPLPDEAEVAGAWARSVWVTKSSGLFETCNLGYRRSAFEAAGGFDVVRPDRMGRTRVHFGEDAELGWRVSAAGAASAYEAGALVHHRVHPGNYAEWLREQRRVAMFPALVRKAPGLGRKLRLGVFLSVDTASFDLALAGVVFAAVRRVPWPLVLALPWAVRRWRAAANRPGRPRLVRVAQLALGDLVILGSLLQGSVRHRRVIL